MLENTSVIQNKVSKELATLVNNGTLPRSLLFSGGSYTGRLTASLETIEAIVGKGGLYKSVGNIFLYLSRPLTVDFNTKTAVYLSSETESAFLKVKEALFILILAISYSSLRSKEDKAILDKESEAEFLNIFSSFLDEKEEDKPSRKEKVERARELAALMKTQSAFSIEDVRIFKETSAQYSNNDKGKFYIIEGLGDASVGAKNAFLKLLEEPPENTYFFIIESDKAKLGETILSRLTPFNFRSITKTVKNNIIASYFDNGKDYETLYDFFLERGCPESKEVEESGYRCGEALFSGFSDGVYNRETARYYVKKEFAKARGTSVNQAVLFTIFIQSFLKSFVRYMFKDPLLSSRATAFIHILSYASARCMVLNQNPRNVLYSLIDETIDLCYNK